MDIAPKESKVGRPGYGENFGAGVYIVTFVGVYAFYGAKAGHPDISAVTTQWTQVIGAGVYIVTFVGVYAVNGAGQGVRRVLV